MNNASELGVIRPLLTSTCRVFGRIFPVNAGAPLALIQLGVPLLAERRGLIVNITSDAARGAYPGLGTLRRQQGCARTVDTDARRRTARQGVSAVLVDPGDMRTRMHQEAFPLEDISDRPLPDVTAPFWDWLFDSTTPVEVSGGRFAAQPERRGMAQPA